MKKDVIKEIFIVVLLGFLIILLLGVILYDYVPANKEIPAEISYSTPQNVKSELQSGDGVDEDKVILTYKIDKTDLYNYQRVNDYKPGKTNPFSTYKTPNVENSSVSGNNTVQNSSSTTTDVTTSSNSTNTNTVNTTNTKTNTNTDTKINTNTKTNTNTVNTTVNNTNSSTNTTEPGTVNPGNYTQNKGLK